MAGRMASKRALITGAGSGMGAAEARLFAAEGASVLLADAQMDSVAALATELGTCATSYYLDVTAEADWDEFAATLAMAGGIDVLVHNAGFLQEPSLIVETSLLDYQRSVEVNQIGTFLAVRTAMRLMRTNATAGSIVLLSSVQGLRGAVAMAGYVSSKFAVRGLAKVSALEGAASGIRVNSIHPGAVDTAMMSPYLDDRDARAALTNSIPLGRVARAEEIAELACWLASDASSYCTGAEFVIDGGSTAGVFRPPRPFVSLPGDGS